MKTLVKQALTVAKKYPVFPTSQKMPCWSNKELGVGRGEGGYKIATQDPKEVERLFSHPRATEIAIPMGCMSGLICVDVDAYKGEEIKLWLDANEDLLSGTMCHQTRSGGLHYFFKHPGDNIKFPSTLRPGVDLKAGGNGYVCFPPTEGYKKLNNLTAKSFPMTLLSEAMKAKGGTGSVTLGSGFNDATDDELVDLIKGADDLYPALRTLSYRLVQRREDPENVIAGLQHLMSLSVAADPNHPRHDDWGDRKSKIRDLVESAADKHSSPIMNAETAKLLAETDSFIDTQKMIAASMRPTGPQRETEAVDIEVLVTVLVAAKENTNPEEDTSTFTSVSAATLGAEQLKPIEWIVPQMIPASGTVSLGGTSNVGKTRWLAALAALGASSSLPLMGLPSAPAFATLWLANEERVDDIKRRLKSTFLQHGIMTSDAISIRGKDAGMLRLVALDGNSGNPVLDEGNIALIVAEARRIGAKLIFFDPYVTLSDAMDENSATSAAMLTRAFTLISTLTGAAVIHAHHTPKDRTKDEDWYRGDSGAWRGSGAIYSALDCGYTLSHWMPKGKDSRKSWKQNYIDQNLSRWIVLDTGKIREGKPLSPIIYELVGQPMAEGEGDEIGVCRLAEEHEANNALLDEAIDVIIAAEVAMAIFNTAGPGEYGPQPMHKKMKGHKLWKYSGSKIQPRETEELHTLLRDKVLVEGGFVQLILDENRSTTGRWIFVVGAE